VCCFYSSCPGAAQMCLCCWQRWLECGRQSPLRRPPASWRYMLQRLVPRRLLCHGIAPFFTSKMRKTGPPWHRGRHGRGYREGRQRTPWRWPLLMRMLNILSERLPSLRASMRRSVGPGSWLRKIPVACLMRRPMTSVGGRCLRGSAGCNLRRSASIDLSL
jgi:hypothetical protein